MSRPVVAAWAVTTGAADAPKPRANASGQTRPPRMRRMHDPLDSDRCEPRARSLTPPTWATQAKFVNTGHTVRCVAEHRYALLSDASAHLVHQTASFGRKIPRRRRPRSPRPGCRA